MTDFRDIVAALFSAARDATGGSDMEHWVRVHRLESLVYGVELDAFSWREEFLDECRRAYMNMIGRSRRFMSETDRLLATLEAAGVEGYAWRGAVHGEKYYGDPALRYFTDIDLMVHPVDKWHALAVLQKEGYQLRNRVVPRWYLARHHLHWPLLSRDGTFPVDLHWAVDHPYRDTATFKLPAGVPDEVTVIAIACLHAEKESRLRYCSNESDAVRQVLTTGAVLPWLDLALMVNRAAPDVIARLLALPVDDATRGVIMNGLWVARRCFAVDLPGGCIAKPVFASGIRARMHAAMARIPAASKLGEILGCRPDALVDWIDYLVAGANRKGVVRRVWSFAGRFVRVIMLFLESFVCGVYVAVKKMRELICGVRVAA